MCLYCRNTRLYHTLPPVAVAPNLVRTVSRHSSTQPTHLPPTRQESFIYNSFLPPFTMTKRNNPFRRPSSSRGGGGQAASSRSSSATKRIPQPPPECFDPRFFHNYDHGNDNTNGRDHDITFVPKPPPPPPPSSTNTSKPRKSRKHYQNSTENDNYGATTSTSHHDNVHAVRANGGTSAGIASRHRHHHDPNYQQQQKSPQYFHNHLSECYYTDGSDENENEWEKNQLRHGRTRTSGRTDKPSHRKNANHPNEHHHEKPFASSHNNSNNNNNRTTTSTTSNTCTYEKENMKISHRHHPQALAVVTPPASTQQRKTPSNYRHPTTKSSTTHNTNNGDHEEGDENCKPTFWNTTDDNQEEEYGTTNKDAIAAIVSAGIISSEDESGDNGDKMDDDMKNEKEKERISYFTARTIPTTKDRHSKKKNEARNARLSHKDAPSNHKNHENDHHDMKKAKRNLRTSYTTNPPPKKWNHNINNSDEEERPSLWRQHSDDNMDGTTTSATARAPISSSSAKSGARISTTSDGANTIKNLPPPPLSLSSLYSASSSLDRSRHEKEKMQQQQTEEPRRPMLWRDTTSSSNFTASTPSLKDQSSKREKEKLQQQSLTVASTARRPMLWTDTTSSSDFTASLPAQYSVHNNQIEKRASTTRSPSPMPSRTTLNDQMSTTSSTKVGHKNTTNNSNNSITRSLSSLNDFQDTTSDENDDHNHNSFGDDSDLESVQSQQRTMMPGAFAIEGFESHLDTGYDSGFEDDEGPQYLSSSLNHHDANGSTNPPPLVPNTTSMVMPENEDDISQISAEIVEELQICDGQHLNDDEKNDSPRIKGWIICAIICASAIIITIVVATMKVRNFSSDSVSTGTVDTDNTIAATASILKPTSWFLMGNDTLEFTPDESYKPTNNDEEETVAFGNSVSLSGNGDRVVVGIPGGWDNGLEKRKQGKAQIHYLDGSDEKKWTFHQELIQGVSSKAEAGKAVAMSKDGTHVVVSAPFEYGVLGHVAMYIEDNTPAPASASSMTTSADENNDWTMVGDALAGVSYSIASSGDGKIVALTQLLINENGSRCKPVQVYRYPPQDEDDNNNELLAFQQEYTENSYYTGRVDNNDDEDDNNIDDEKKVWNLYGKHPIVNPVETFCTTSLTLSADGQYLALASVNQDTNFNGQVRVYSTVHDENFSVTWEKTGQVLEGNDKRRLFGTSLSLSDDGKVLAIGAPGMIPGKILSSANQQQQEAQKGEGKGIWGYTSIYKYQEGPRNWEPLGQELTGKDPSDCFGYSVSLSGNGRIVAAGAPCVNNYSGQVKLYKLREDESTLPTAVTDDESPSPLWLELGGGIGYGYERSAVEEFDYFGWSVSMSSDGYRVAIGSPGTSYENRILNVGSVGVYELAM